jgi:hypothetical protein
LSTRLPGRPRPAAEALADYHRQRADWIASRADPRKAAALADFLWGSGPEYWHRWRIQLDCGHIHEAYTGGKDELPSSAAGWTTPDWHILPDESVCYEEGCYRAGLEREIVSWDRRDGEVPPDPADPPEWWDGDPEVWSLTRHLEPRAWWAVTLACGHPERVITALAWQPADGITRRPVADAEQQRRRDWLLAKAEADGDEHTRRYIIDGFPEPDPFTECHTCTRARKITGQEYVGPLVPPERKPRPAPDPKTVLKRQLRDAERQAADLRRQLAALDPDEP